MTKAISIFISSILLASSLSACGPKEAPQPIIVEKIEHVKAKENKVSGDLQEEAWVEQMYDRVDVPGQLDPTGTYYRLPHKTIYEIRPGRYQEVQYPNKSQ